MVDAGYIDAGGGRPRRARAARRRAARARSRGAVLRRLRRRRRSTSSIPGLTTTTDQAVDVYTTLDLHLQRLAQDAVRDGLTKVDQLLSRRKRRGQGRSGADRGRSADRRDPRDGRRPLVQPVAVQPRDRLAAAAGIGLQAVRLPRRVRAGRRRRDAPTSRRRRSSTTTPTTWEFDDQVWTPENYEDEYDGPITFRRALAHSRNLATIKVAEAAGYDHVAALWKKLGVGNAAEGRIRRSRSACSKRRRSRSPRPTRCSRTCGVDAAAAAHRCGSTSGGKDVTQEADARRRATIARPDTTFLVTNMMRSVINEGTGAGARGAGLHARRRRQDRHDQRPARRLVRRLHAGAADGGLGRLRRQPAARAVSGAQAALPIWTQFMTRALAGRAERAVRGARRASASSDIDPDTGKLATPRCPRRSAKRSSPAPSRPQSATCIGT